MKKRLVNKWIFILAIQGILSASVLAEESFTANTVDEYVEKLNKWAENEITELYNGKKIVDEGKNVEEMMNYKNSLLKRCNRIPWYVVTEMKDKAYKIASEHCYIAMEFYNNSKKAIETNDKTIKERALNQFNYSRRMLEKDLVKELLELKNTK